MSEEKNGKQNTPPLDTETTVPSERLEKRPLFDDFNAMEGGGKENNEGEGNLRMSEEEKPKSSVEAETEKVPLEAEETLASSRISWRWIAIGAGGFIFALLVAIFFASLYLHKKEAKMSREKTPKIAIQSLVKEKKRVIIKPYSLQPFFVRLKNSKSGEDRFLSAKIYIEFVRKTIPEEITTQREVLRTLIYKQLVKHFADGRDNPEKEKKFEKELIPALNTFFHGGGVYDLGFKELVIR